MRVQSMAMRCGVLCLVLAGSDPLSSRAGDRTAPVVPAWLRDDAHLSTVCFIDERTGWAAGDRGTIWHTEDGGSTWSQQPSGIGETLHGMSFLDARRGWAVGGDRRPYGNSTRGIVLATRDGGLHWRRAANTPLLPALGAVRFFDPHHGMAVGAASSLFSAGIYRSGDGGRSWNPLGAAPPSSWRSAELLDARTGLVVGPRSPIGRLAAGVLTAIPLPDLSLRSVRDVAIGSPRSAWVVGDGGLVLQSQDQGMRWHRPVGSLPPWVADWFDFRAVAARGDACWIAGTPGSMVFHSPDGGRSWSAYRTGQPLPIVDLVMLPGGKGWAVGAMGTILATCDAGRTWQRQRGGDRRAALLALLSEPGKIPLEVITQLAEVRGYRTVVDTLMRPWPRADRGRLPPLDGTVHQAVVRVGGCCGEQAWQFPADPGALRLSADAVFAQLDRFHNGDARRRFESHLVRQIRMWRPSLVMTHAGTVGDHPIDRLVARATVEAVRAAADPRRYKVLGDRLGLQPWSVDRVIGLLPAGESGPLSIATGQIAARLAGSLADHAFVARGVIAGEVDPVPSRYHFRTMIGSAAPAGRHGDFFRGLAIAPGGDAQRALGAVPLENIAQLKQAARRQRTAVELLRRARSHPAWLSQIGVLTEGLDATTAGRLLYRAAREDATSGHFASAAEVFEALVTAYPRHPLTERALTWLLHYRVSGEAAQRERSGAADPPLARGAAGPEAAGASENRQAAFSQGAKNTAAPTPAAGAGRAARLRQAVQLGEQLERTHPELLAEPAIRFPLYVAYRELGEAEAARRLLRALRHVPDEAWAAAARAEARRVAPPRRHGRAAGATARSRDPADRRVGPEAPGRPDHLPENRSVSDQQAKNVARRDGSPIGRHGPAAGAKRTYPCRRIAVRPTLDGTLDEPCWQAAEAASLRGLADSPCPPATVRFAWDDQFFYIGLQCQNVPDATLPPATRTRPRDPDLSRHDRVDLLIDIDRDYVTYYRLSLDHRGWVGEACWEDPTWNPPWYVASSRDNRHWTVEAAIALRELADPPPRRGTAWALGVQRVVPGTGFQAWTAPADLRIVPEGFGLLLFE